jgi:hypothetical protein
MLVNAHAQWIIMPVCCRSLILVFSYVLFYTSDSFNGVSWTGRFCSYWWLNTKSYVALVLSLWIRTTFESVLTFSVHTVIMVVARFVWVKCYQILGWQKKISQILTNQNKIFYSHFVWINHTSTTVFMKECGKHLFCLFILYAYARFTQYVFPHIGTSCGS